MTGDQNVSTVKGEKRALEVWCMFGSAEESKSLRASVIELEEASKLKSRKLQAELKTTKMEVVAD